MDNNMPMIGESRDASSDLRHYRLQHHGMRILPRISPSSNENAEYALFNMFLDRVTISKTPINTSRNERGNYPDDPHEHCKCFRLP
jgi:hypothetical protein